MAYVKIWTHCVWGTKNRQPFLTKENKWEIIRHIKDNANTKGIVIDHINGDKEHLHSLISMSSTQNIAEIMQLIKGESSFWINKNHLTAGRFEWADEYYAASVGESQIQVIRNYIKNQEEHHRHKIWDEECNEFLEKYGFVKTEG